LHRHVGRIEVAGEANTLVILDALDTTVVRRNPAASGIRTRRTSSSSARAVVR
jgi:hypothetical protein